MPFAPTATLPKAALVGLADMPGTIPVPVRDTEIGEFDVLFVTDAVPVALPAACGANWSWTVTL